jgi:hypothetical protein
VPRFDSQQTPSFLAVAVCSILLASGTVTSVTRPIVLLHSPKSIPPPAPNSVRDESARTGKLVESKILEQAAFHVVSVPGGPRLEVMGSGLVSNAVWEVGCRLNGGD